MARTAARAKVKMFRPCKEPAGANSKNYCQKNDLTSNVEL